MSVVRFRVYNYLLEGIGVSTKSILTTYCFAKDGKLRNTAWHAHWEPYSFPTVAAGKASSHDTKSIASQGMPLLCRTARRILRFTQDG